MVWAILCRNAIIDQRSNNVSLIEVIDEITIPVQIPESITNASDQPVMVTDASLVILCARSDFNVPEKSLMRQRIVAPDGDEARTNENEIDLTDDVRLRAIGHIAGFPPLITQDGEFTIKIEVKAPDSDWQEMFELPLWVTVQTDTLSDQPSAS